LRHSEVV